MAGGVLTIQSLVSDSGNPAALVSQELGLQSYVTTLPEPISLYLRPTQQEIGGV